MPNVIPTHDELMDALEKKRERAANARVIQATRWKQRGKTVMTLELAREIRELSANSELTHREIAERFNVSPNMVGRVLRHTIFPER